MSVQITSTLSPVRIRYDEDNAQMQVSVPGRGPITYEEDEVDRMLRTIDVLRHDDAISDLQELFEPEMGVIWAWKVAVAIDDCYEALCEQVYGTTQNR